MHPYTITHISLLYSRLFSLGENFPEFPEWARDSGKFILGCCIMFDCGLLSCYFCLELLLYGPLFSPVDLSSSSLGLFMTRMTSVLAAAIVEGSILVLYGPLGSGKSALQHSLAK